MLLNLQVKELQSFLEPLLSKVLDSVTQETGDDWGKCFTDISVSHMEWSTYSYQLD